MTGGFSRSAAGAAYGASTPAYGAVAGAAVAAAAAALAGLFRCMPRCALAAIVVVAALGLVDAGEAALLWRSARRECGRIHARPHASGRRASCCTGELACGRATTCVPGAVGRGGGKRTGQNTLTLLSLASITPNNNLIKHTQDVSPDRRPEIPPRRPTSVDTPARAAPCAVSSCGVQDLAPRTQHAHE